MKPRKLKELLVFAVVHKAPELLPVGKKEQLEDALMKLNADELEVLEDFISKLVEQSKPVARRRRGAVAETEDEEDVALEEEPEKEKAVV